MENETCYNLGNERGDEDEATKNMDDYWIFYCQHMSFLCTILFE